jgi:hypothetical protein
MTAILALIGLVSSRNRVRRFFGAYAGFGLLKIFGVPPVQYLGLPPVFRTVVFPKYLQPAVAFSPAVLVGLAWAEIRSRQVTGTILVRLGVAAVAGCTGFAWAYGESLTATPQPLVRLSVGLCILFACGVGLGAALLGWLHKRDFRRSNVGIYGLVVLEVVVLAVRLHPARRSSSEPEDAPVVRRLLAEPNGDCRIFGDYPLFPNTASGVQIPDLRILDPILPKNLVSSFQELAGSPIWSRFPFREFDEYEHPALDFLGVRYVVSTRDVRNLLLRPRPTEPRHRLLQESESGRGIQPLLVEPDSVQTFPLCCAGGGIALLVQLTSGRGESCAWVINREFSLRPNWHPAFPGSGRTKWFRRRSLGRGCGSRWKRTVTPGWPWSKPTPLKVPDSCCKALPERKSLFTSDPRLSRLHS